MFWCCLTGYKSVKKPTTKWRRNNYIIKKRNKNCLVCNLNLYATQILFDCWLLNKIDFWFSAKWILEFWFGCKKNHFGGSLIYLKRGEVVKSSHAITWLAAWKWGTYGNGTNISHLFNCRSARMKSDGEDAHSLNVYKNASTTSHGMREDEGKTDALCSIWNLCNIKAGRVLHVQ